MGHRNGDAVDSGGLSHGWTRSHKERVSHDRRGGPGHPEGVMERRTPSRSLRMSRQRREREVWKRGRERDRTFSWESLGL